MYRESQNQKILAYLKSGSGLTQLEALNKFGCMRLGARVWELRHMGYPIVANIVNVSVPGEEPVYVAEYSLKTEGYAG